MVEPPHAAAGVGRRRVVLVDGGTWRGLAHEPLLMLLALLLGSLMVTGLAFLLASVSRDLLSVMGWGILAILLLVIPALNVLLPGTASGWAQVIPSYYLVDTVNGVTNFDLGWADVAGNLLALLLFAVAFLALGIFALQRRQQRAFART